MLLPFFLCALLQAPQPEKPFVACTLEIHGSLNTRRPGAQGVETLSETFQYALHGWMREVEQPGGQVAFEFHQTKDPKRPPWGSLNRRTEAPGKSPHPWLQFYGSEFRSVGLFRFEADLRGQNLYPSGELTVIGRTTSHHRIPPEGAEATTTPFPLIRHSRGDHGAPTLRFTVSNLWRLQRAHEPFSAKALVTYQNKAGAASYAGRVDLTFRLDPRQRADTP